jgi:predicted nucleic acid-binding protein
MYANHCFVDTSAWFALFVPHDPAHAPLRDIVRAFGKRLLTTDYILDELLTLLRARGQSYRAAAAWDLLHAADLVTLIHLSEADLAAAWSIFLRFDDKRWSFTDCTSKQIIDSYQISTACSLDHHFRQFGQLTMLPPQIQ